MKPETVWCVAINGRWHMGPYWQREYAERMALLVDGGVVVRCVLKEATDDAG